MNVRSILPFDNYILVTRLSETEVLKRLHDHVGAHMRSSSTRWSIRNGTLKPYAGMVRGRHFDITRATDYNHPFLPVIKGNVETYPGQTEVMVKMRLHSFALVISALWMFVVLTICIVTSWRVLLDGYDPSLLKSYGMAIFGGLLFTIPYKLEAKKSRNFLAALLEVEAITIV